jgi:hypothetical protein
MVTYANPLVERIRIRDRRLTIFNSRDAGNVPGH